VRLTAASAKRTLSIGQARISGGSAVVAVRNTGNTVDPVGGSVKLSGPRGTVNATITAVRILPGATVDLKLAPASKLPKGKWTATVALVQGSKKFPATKRTFNR
jgi:hypothetical protein